MQRFRYLSIVAVELRKGRSSPFRVLQISPGGGLVEVRMVGRVLPREAYASKCL